MLKSWLRTIRRAIRVVTLGQLLSSPGSDVSAELSTTSVVLESSLQAPSRQPVNLGGQLADRVEWYVSICTEQSVGLSSVLSFGRLADQRYRDSK